MNSSQETPASETSDPEGVLHKNPFRYRGYYYDEETGWYYLQSRYYDPHLKRFINADSTDLLTIDCTNLMQYNLSMYCNGDPIGNSDKSGHDPITDIVYANVLLGISEALITITIKCIETKQKSC